MSIAFEHSDGLGDTFFLAELPMREDRHEFAVSVNSKGESLYVGMGLDDLRAMRAAITCLINDVEEYDRIVAEQRKAALDLGWK